MKTASGTRFLLPDPLAALIAIPLLGGLMILQTSIVSRLPLLQGTPDLVMLAIIAWALHKRVQTAWHWCIIGGLIYSLVSALPVGVPLVCYALVTWLALELRKRVWQVPILAMFLMVLLGTLITHAVAYTSLVVTGDPLVLLEAFNLVTLPSLLLNILFALPIYAIITDLAKWVYPEELEV
jgi:rod shape-determining protein MreD